MTQDPTVYFTKPIEDWSFVELTDALGSAVVAETLDISRLNVRVLRHRGGARLDRVMKLQDKFLTDPEFYRRRMVTLKRGSASPPKPTAESTHA